MPTFGLLKLINLRTLESESMFVLILREHEVPIIFGVLIIEQKMLCDFNMLKKEMVSFLDLNEMIKYFILPPITHYGFFEYCVI